MVEWHHRLNAHESEQTLGDNDRQGSLVSWSPCSHKESDMTEQLNITNNEARLSVWTWESVSLHWLIFSILQTISLRN